MPIPPTFEYEDLGDFEEDLDVICPFCSTDLEDVEEEDSDEDESD